MVNIFLSYARADGAAAAETLRQEVTQMGFTVWQDVEQMRGGKAWREQLHDALQGVDALLALLTPGYVASTMCTWEWRSALKLGRRVVPLLIAPCDIPDELARLHYHNLSDPNRYPLGLATLARDLIELIPATPPQPAVGAGAKYSIRGHRNTIIGEGATVIRVSGADASALSQNILSTLAQLRANAGPHQAEFDAVLREISAQLGAVNR
ncbi:MAG: TIR domain-containing protein [Caldilineaceae bacterium]|nr:TIR domain-containing protein [Caldilineaceae bacterium]